MKNWFFALSLALMGVAPAFADESLSAKLESRRLGAIDPGTYQAGDNVIFSLARWNDKYLLRFNGDPEIYVLYPASTTMGGRILKYDTSATAISVSGWGGITVYTDAKPDGLPAVRADDHDPMVPKPQPVKFQELRHAASDESAHLSYVRNVNVAFTADWDRLSQHPGSWAQAFEVIENAGRGIEKFTAKPRNRERLIRHLQTVRFQDGMRPAIAINGKTLLVTFDASKAYAGRPSSRAIEHALGHMLGQKRPQPY
jgi:hypothetical protein